MTAIDVKVSVVMVSFHVGFDAVLVKWLQGHNVSYSEFERDKTRIYFDIYNYSFSDIIYLIERCGPESLHRATVAFEGAFRTIRGLAFEDDNKIRDQALGIHMPLGAKPSEIARARKISISKS